MTINRCRAIGKMQMNQNKSLDSLLQQGHHFLKRGQYEAGLEIFREVDSLFPNNQQVKYGFGLAYYRLEQYQKCIDCLNLALQLQPVYPLALIRRGMAYRALKQTEQANADFETVLAMKLQTHEDWRARGLAFDKLKQSHTALECYDKALEIEPNDHQSWHNKGLTLKYLQRFNEALECFAKALEIFPDRFFSISSRGDALSSLQRHQEALESYKYALELKPQDTYSLSMAGGTLLNLGRFEEAVANYDQALKMKPDDFVTLYGKSLALTILKQHETALFCCEKALAINPDCKLSKKLWAQIQIRLGIAYKQSSTGNRKENLELAITAYHNALQVCTQADFPQDWAMGQANLGSVYSLRIAGNRRENIEQAIAAYEAALKVYTQANFPHEWVKIHINLGSEYCERIAGNRRENIEQAIAAYKATLRVYTEEDFPHEWADVYRRLGGAYFQRIAGDRKENTEQAIIALNAALRVYTEENFPNEWAKTQNSLGATYLESIVGDEKENIEQAIAAFENALRVHTEQEYLAATQINLGGAYIKRIVGDEKENIERAIAAFESALRVYAEEIFPYDWAKTQSLLGVAYIKRMVGDKRENFQQGIITFTAAFRVITETDFPHDWANTQYNLGLAYRDCISGDRRENLDQAIECFQAALKIRTSKAYPIKCLQTSRSLGNLALEQKRWQLAINAYATAIEAVELSRHSASSEARKQEILSGAISVYVNMARACIQDGQYVRAIEYLERSKTRNLVDLLTERQMYPTGEFPQQITDSLDALRRNLIAAERRLQQKKTEECFNRLASLRHSMEYLLRTHIQPVDPSFQLSQRVEPISFSQIQAALPTPQTALIEWCVSKDTFTIFIVTRNRTQPLVITKDFEEVQTLTEIKDKYLSKYREYKDKWQERLILFLYQLARTLEWDEVIESLKQVLPDCNRIILVPHRWLHIIPLHALPLKDGRCLLDLFSQGVSYAPSVQLLELTQKEVWVDTEDKKDREDKKFFAVQNPTEDPDLPYTSVEVAAIRKQFQPHDDVLAGKEGHRQALTTERLSQANYTHFSCHGTFNFEKPERSALLLADSVVEMEEEGDKKEKGDKTRYLPSRDGSYIDLEKCLTLGEIFGLDLRSCRLVTLSACETGLTDIKNLSDEYIGLPSGFLYAGSPSVVSSLWAVSDLSTTFLMIKFYQNLQTMDSVAIALNQAQLWLRGVTKEELAQWKTTLDIPGAQKFEIDAALRRMPDNSYPFAAPSHWATFCAVGS